MTSLWRANATTAHPESTVKVDWMLLMAIVGQALIAQALLQ